MSDIIDSPVSGRNGQVSSGDLPTDSDIEGQPYGIDTGEGMTLQDIYTELQTVNTCLSVQAEKLDAQTAVMQDGVLLLSIVLGLIAGMLLMIGFWEGRK